MPPEFPGTDPGFQVRGAHLKKLCRAEGGGEIFGVFRVKNHDFTPKYYIFSNFSPQLDPPLMPTSFPFLFYIWLMHSCKSRKGDV
jgi:hypothetical protein